MLLVTRPTTGATLINVGQLRNQSGKTNNGCNLINVGQLRNQSGKTNNWGGIKHIYPMTLSQPGAGRSPDEMSNHLTLILGLPKFVMM